MNKELSVRENDDLSMIEEVKNTCKALMDTPHYKKLGQEGIFAVVEKARSIGLNPIDALNGGMYFVQGKVEMSSSLMNQMIRQQGHSITKDKRSSDTICILHGRRADNGDTWTESFSIKEAQTAGIYKGPWQKYPRDMLFARALTRLARQLFPDVIKGCYIEGEIQAVVDNNSEKIVEVEATINEEQLVELKHYLDQVPELEENILAYLEKKSGIKSLEEIPVSIFDNILNRVKLRVEERQDQHEEAVND